MIDSQYMIIFNVLNIIYKILKDKNEREKFSLKYFTDILYEFILKHFRSEENIMKKYKIQHEQFIKLYNDFKQNYVN